MLILAYIVRVDSAIYNGYQHFCYIHNEQNFEFRFATGVLREEFMAHFFTRCTPARSSSLEILQELQCLQSEPLRIKARLHSQKWTFHSRPFDVYASSK